jgi:hypothetical protein
MRGDNAVNDLLLWAMSGRPQIRIIKRHVFFRRLNSMRKQLRLPQLQYR